MGTSGQRRYEAPRLQDYGTVVQLTAATSILETAEDGASKQIAQHHSAPSLP